MASLLIKEPEVQGNLDRRLVVASSGPALVEQRPKYLVDKLQRRQRRCWTTATPGPGFSSPTPN